MTDKPCPTCGDDSHSLTIAYMYGAERAKETMIPRADADMLLEALKRSGIDLSEEDRIKAIENYEQKHGAK